MLLLNFLGKNKLLINTHIHCPLLLYEIHVIQLESHALNSQETLKTFSSAPDFSLLVGFINFIEIRVSRVSPAGTPRARVTGVTVSPAVLAVSSYYYYHGRAPTRTGTGPTPESFRPRLALGVPADRTPPATRRPPRHYRST